MSSNRNLAIAYAMSKRAKKYADGGAVAPEGSVKDANNKLHDRYAKPAPPAPTKETPSVWENIKQGFKIKESKDGTGYAEGGEVEEQSDVDQPEPTSEDSQKSLLEQIMQRLHKNRLGSK